MQLPELHDVFLAILDWNGDLGYIIRVHGQEFNSFRRKTPSRPERLVGMSSGGPSWPPGYTDAMANAHPLNWKLKLIAEIAPGEHVEIDVAAWERPQEVSLATLGLSLEEGKEILAEVQRRMVTTQM